MSLKTTVPGSDANEDFVHHLTAAQPQLYSYVLSLLPEPEAAMDVVQETNLVLWRKAAEFTSGRFTTWACAIARFQVMAYRRDVARGRKVFSDRLVDELADSLVDEISDLELMQPLLERCLEKLSMQNRALLDARYAKGGSVSKLARQHQKSTNAISRTLYRLRLILLGCIQQSAPKEHSS